MIPRNQHHVNFLMFSMNVDSRLGKGTDEGEPTFAETTRMQKFIQLLLKNRCRKLDKEQVDILFSDITEELLLANSFYDENNI